MHSLADRCLVKTFPNPDPWLSLVDSLMLKLLEDSDETQTSGASIAARAAIYHLRLGGQRIRARLALDACACLGVEEINAVALGACVELLHNASLIHDDLQDKDHLRRGAQAVWAKFDSDVAICAGDLLLSAAYCAIAQVNCTSMLPIFLQLIHSKVSGAVKGQCADLALDSLQTLNLKTYQEIAINKSGTLLSLPLELALTAGGESNWISKARQAAHDFAVAYQIYDDLQDFEKDSVDDCVLNSNILGILKSDPACKDMRQTAINLGILKLEQVKSVSANLPMNSGYLLRDLADKLHTQFKLVSNY